MRWGDNADVETQYGDEDMRHVWEERSVRCEVVGIGLPVVKWPRGAQGTVRLVW